MLRKSIFYLSLIVLCGCHNSSTPIVSDKNKDSFQVKTINRLDTAKVGKQTDTAHQSTTKSEEIDPDSVFSAHAVNIICGFPEVKLASNYIDSLSGGKRGVIIRIWGLPTKEDPYYEIDVGDDVPFGDSTGHFDMYMHFHVYNRNEQAFIKYYAIQADTEYTLKDWRKIESRIKQKGKKYYFFYFDSPN